MKKLFLFLVLAACAAVVLYWWRSRPVFVDGEIAKDGEVWVKADQPGKILRVLVQPEQGIGRDDPLLGYQPEPAQPVEEDAPLRVAVLEGTLSQGALDGYEKKLRGEEEKAEKEVLRLSTEASRAVFQRRSLEQGGDRSHPEALEQARETERRTTLALREAEAAFAKASQARAQAIEKIGRFFREAQAMPPQEKKALLETYQKRLKETANPSGEQYMRSPVAGVVIESRATPGGALQPGQPLFLLRPLNHGEFSCQARVPADRIKTCAPGTYCEAEVSGKLYPGRIVALNKDDTLAANGTGQTTLIMNFSSIEDDAPYALPTGTPVRIALYPNRQAAE